MRDFILRKEDVTKSQELKQMAGNAMALRAVAVAIIIGLRAIDPALLERFLVQ